MQEVGECMRSREPERRCGGRSGHARGAPSRPAWPSSTAFPRPASTKMNALNYLLSKSKSSDSSPPAADGSSTPADASAPPAPTTSSPSSRIPTPSRPLPSASVRMPPASAWSAARAKVQLKLSIQRIRLLAAKKSQLAKVSRRDIAGLLEKGKIEGARIRCEGVMGEDQMVELLEVLELYCEVCLSRFGLLELVGYVRVRSSGELVRSSTRQAELMSRFCMIQWY